MSDSIASAAMPCPLWVAVSTGQRNSLSISFNGCLKVQSLP